MTDLPSLDDSPSAKTRDVAMAFLAMIPTVSGFAQLITAQVWEDPRNASMRRFAEALAERVIELEKKVDIDVEEILRRPETQPLLRHAFDAASKSVGEKKLEALKNAAAQGIFERGYAFDLSVMVFSLLDRLTEGHLKLLQALIDKFNQHHQAAWPSKASLTTHDVPTLPTDAGMRQPKQIVFDDGGFIDEYLVLINKMLVDDLLNMGLIAEVLGSPTGVVGMSSGGPTNMPSTIQLTDKGRLVFEHLFPADALD
ncbi:hypothetical protein GFL85_24680 [Rhizobium laguerreae]|uniref:hypothetical protein n=1 Tax=Rhizobium laguerreae TaxID=1076926 RepID=UPI00143F2B80|nr:hypothetical protein [Rhizobium laguerreae]NKM14176.1 hypothetical protein [Rhizobium laguerreae]